MPEIKRVVLRIYTKKFNNHKENVVILEVDYLGRDARKLSFINYRDDVKRKFFGFVICGVLVRYVSFM